MPMKNWVTHRFRQDGGDQSDGDANPVFEEVTSTNGLPVKIVGGVQTTPNTVPSAAPDNSTSTAEEASRVVKGGPGILYGFTVYNNNAATRYIQVFDSVALPADGVVPPLTFEVATQTTRAIDFGQYGRRFNVGIVLCNSSTDTTKTIGAADSLFDAQVM